MRAYEYKVIPAPKKGQKSKGIRGSENRFAHALEIVMNDQATSGWEYLRNDTLPCEERNGFRGKTTTYQNMLVFRRSIPDADIAAALVSAPVPDTDRIEPPLTLVDDAEIKAVETPTQSSADAEPESPFDSAFSSKRTGGSTDDAARDG